MKTYRSTFHTKAVYASLCFGAGLLTFATAPSVEAQAAPTLSVVNTFAVADGEPIYGQLALDGMGGVYGTTLTGGAKNHGTVFKVSTVGEYGIVHSFGASSDDGTAPYGSVVRLGDGTFYGTTFSGGSFGGGTIFKVSSVGEYAVLHSFGQGTDGKLPLGAPSPTSQGGFYGATFGGGANSTGALYFIDGQGAYNQFYSFTALTSGDHNNEGAQPFGSPVSAASGIYGAAFGGGTGGMGTIYRVFSSTIVGAVHTFSGTDGANPYVSPLEGADGNLYGTATVGGDHDNGTIYRLKADTTFTRLHSFEARDADGHNIGGAEPFGGLVQDGTGMFYGTTVSGGSHGLGTIFAITPDGAFTTLHDFADEEGGGTPSGTLVLDADGNLYGTTSKDSDQTGAVYKLTLPPVITSALTATAMFGQPFTYQITATHGVENRYQISDLPAGLSFDDQGGTIMGTPTQAGTFNLTFTTFNDAGPVSDTLVLTVAPAPLPTVTLTATVGKVKLGSGLAGVATITLSAPLDHKLIVRYTAKGSAEDGTDYVHLSGKVKIKAGKTSKDINILPLGNLGGAAKKTVVLALTPSDVLAIGGTGRVKIKILAAP